MQMKFEQEDDSSDFSFHFIKKHDDTGVFVPIFRCQSDKTTVQVQACPSRGGESASTSAAVAAGPTPQKPQTYQVNHGTGMVTYTSPDLSCELTCVPGSDRSCSKILDGVVKAVGSTWVGRLTARARVASISFTYYASYSPLPTVGGGSTIVCDPFAKSCDVNEATLKMFLNGAVKVRS